MDDIVIFKEVVVSPLVSWGADDDILEVIWEWLYYEEYTNEVDSELLDLDLTSESLMISHSERPERIELIISPNNGELLISEAGTQDGWFGIDPEQKGAKAASMNIIRNKINTLFDLEQGDFLESAETATAPSGVTVETATALNGVTVIAPDEIEDDDQELEPVMTKSTMPVSAPVRTPVKAPVLAPLPTPPVLETPLVPTPPPIVEIIPVVPAPNNNLPEAQLPPTMPHRQETLDLHRLRATMMYRAFGHDSVLFHKRSLPTYNGRTVLKAFIRNKDLYFWIEVLDETRFSIKLYQDKTWLADPVKAKHEGTEQEIMSWISQIISRELSQPLPSVPIADQPRVTIRVQDSSLAQIETYFSTFDYLELRMAQAPASTLTIDVCDTTTSFLISETDESGQLEIRVAHRLDGSARDFIKSFEDASAAIVYIEAIIREDSMWPPISADTDQVKVAVSNTTLITGSILQKLYIYFGEIRNKAVAFEYDENQVMHLIIKESQNSDREIRFLYTDQDEWKVKTTTSETALGTAAAIKVINAFLLNLPEIEQDQELSVLPDINQASGLFSSPEAPLTPPDAPVALPETPTTNDFATRFRKRFPNVQIDVQSLQDYDLIAFRVSEHLFTITAKHSNLEIDVRIENSNEELVDSKNSLTDSLAAQAMLDYIDGKMLNLNNPRTSTEGEYTDQPRQRTHSQSRDFWAPLSSLGRRPIKLPNWKT